MPKQLSLKNLEGYEVARADRGKFMSKSFRGGGLGRLYSSLASESSLSNSILSVCL